MMMYEIRHECGKKETYISDDYSFDFDKLNNITENFSCKNCINNKFEILYSYKVKKKIVFELK